MKPSGLLHILAFGLLTLSLMACAPSLPQQVVTQYGEAVAADDPREAYELLSPDLKARVSFKDFKAAWSERRKGLDEYSLEMRAAGDNPARVQATMSYTDYDTLQMRLTDDGWKITSGVLSLYSQETPREALVSFVRALEGRRYEVLMGFVPSKYAQHMSAESLKEDFEARKDEIDELVVDLKANLDSPITEREDVAYMQYGSRKLTFVLEDGLWKIEDPG